MKFDTPAGTNPIDQLKVVGKPTDRIDGPLKVCGQAPYAYEQPAPNAAYGFVVGSAIAKGRIESIDLAAAKASPGVLAIITADNAGKLEKGNFTTAHLLGGENVRLGATYANGGDGGSVYRWLGGSEDVVLGSENYDDDTRWEKFAGGAADPTDLLFPNIGNLTDSDARAFGFLVVMNDVRGGVEASIDHADVTVASGDLTLGGRTNEAGEFPFSPEG